MIYAAPSRIVANAAPRRCSAWETILDGEGLPSTYSSGHFSYPNPLETERIKYQLTNRN